MPKRWNDYAPIPVRLAFGASFAYHSAPFLFTEKGHATFTCVMSTLDLPAPSLMAWLIALLEFAGGTALIAGVLVRQFSSLLAVEMSVYLLMGTVQGGFAMPCHLAQPAPGYQMTILDIAGLLALAIGGGGVWSITRRHG